MWRKRRGILWGTRYALRKATVVRTKILSVTPINPLGVTAPLTSKGSRENGVNAIPCRGYNPSVFSACKQTEKPAPLAQGSRGSRSICLAGSREVRSIRLSSSYSFSFSAAMPGSSLPSRNSKDAPPPVEICVILSAKPSFVTAETESPPPTIETAPEAATASATAKVHFANCGNSKTPMGPFQITVPAPLMAFAYASAVFSPMSMPISPSGMSIPFT